MKREETRRGRRRRRAVLGAPLLMLLPSAAVAGLPATASAVVGPDALLPGSLLVSRVVYTGANGLVAGATQLPPGCTGSNCVTAIADGSYPNVFNNDTVDASFGVTAPIFLDQLSPQGFPLGTVPVPSDVFPNGFPPGAAAHKDQMVTSFSSKSELALNRSTSGALVSFMGYDAPVGAVDVSNSNTPGVVDPTNPVGLANYRVVATVDRHGKFHFTLRGLYAGQRRRPSRVEVVR
jgi:hypothetical protein